MLFNNQRQFKGHQIKNVIDRPILHKKGKKWIVLSMSALALTGLGGFTANLNHAEANDHPHHHINKTSKHKHHHVSTKNISKYAHRLHNKLKARNSKYQHKQKRVNKGTNVGRVKYNVVKPKQSNHKKIRVLHHSKQNLKYIAKPKQQRQVRLNRQIKVGAIRFGDNNDNDISDWDVTGNYYGLDYRYAPKEGALEFTGGTLDWNNFQIGRYYDPNTHSDDIIKTPSDVPVDSIKSIKFSNNINTNDASDLGFYSFCLSDLQSLDLGHNFNISNSHTTEGMFTDDNELQSIKGLSDLDTSNISDMSGMFRGDANLNLDVSHFDTHNVTNMSNMFEDMNDIPKINGLSDFNTSNVRDMSGMFDGDDDLESLDIGHFDTSNVTNMSNMFESDCSYSNGDAGSDGLKDLDLQNFDTSNVTNMADMFRDTEINNINIKPLDTHNVTNMSYMFAFNGDRERKIIGLKNLDTSNVSDMSGMFESDKSNNATSFDLNWNTKNVTAMNDMFSDITGLMDDNGNRDHQLHNITFGPNFDTTKAINKNHFDRMHFAMEDGVSRMFAGDPNINFITIKSHNTKFNTSNSRSKSSFVPTLYKEIGVNDSNGKPYTVKDANDFSKGNLGTFTHKNVPSHPITPTIQKGTINVKYVTSDGKQVGRNYSISAKVGTPFDLTNYIHQVPAGYDYVKFIQGGNVNAVNNGTQNVVIQVAPTNRPTPPQNNRTDTVIFYHGFTPIKTIHKTGQFSKLFNVQSDVPSQYNVNTNTTFHYDGGTHVVKVGVKRPNGYIGVPTEHDTVDTIQFKHGSQIVKQEQKQGQIGKGFDVSNDVPKQYNVHTNTKFTYDGGTHVVQLGVKRPNDYIPAKPQVATDTMSIQYINTNNNQQVGKTVTVKGSDQSPFNINNYTTPSNFPSSYHLNTKDYKNGIISTDGVTNHFIPTKPVIKIAIKPNPITKSLDTIQFKHGNKLIKQERKAGKQGTGFNVVSDVPSQYNVYSNTQFTFDGGTHVVQLGVNRPNDYIPAKPQVAKDTMIIKYIDADTHNQVGNTSTVTGSDGSNFSINQYINNIPSDYYLDTKDYNNGIMSNDGVTNKFISGNPTIKIAIKRDPTVNEIDTIKFMHGSQLIKQERKAGKDGSEFNVKSDVPSQYNVNSGTQFYYDGGTHIVQLGVNRPNGHQSDTPEMDKVDTIDFMHGNQLVKSEQKQGQEWTNFDVINDVPKQYNVHTNTKFTYDGGTHYVQLGVSRPNDYINVHPQIVSDKTDTIEFKHGSQIIKSENKKGISGKSFDVINDVPKQYNVHTGTKFTYDGGTHIVQLGVNRPNGHQSDTPEMDKVDTIKFMHGDKVVKQENKQGQQWTQFNVINDVPKEYNVHTNTIFTYDGGTHYVQLGVNRPNGHINVHPQYANTDTILFKHGSQVVKSEQKSGINGSQFNVINDVPSQYNEYSNTVFSYDGGTHVVQLGVSRPNGYIPVKPQIAKGSITVKYINAKNDRQVGNTITTTANDADPFNMTNYINNTPNGYDLDSKDYEDGVMSNDGITNHYLAGHHTVLIAVVPSPVVHDVDTIQFVNNGKVVKQERKPGIKGTQFNVLSDLPQGYNKHSNTQFTFDGGIHIVELENVTPKPQPKPKPTPNSSSNNNQPNHPASNSNNPINSNSASSSNSIPNKPSSNNSSSNVAPNIPNKPNSNNPSSASSASNIPNHPNIPSNSSSSSSSNHTPIIPNKPVSNSSVTPIKPTPPARPTSNSVSSSNNQPIKPASNKSSNTSKSNKPSSQSSNNNRLPSKSASSNSKPVKPIRPNSKSNSQSNKSKPNTPTSISSHPTYPSNSNHSSKSVPNFTPYHSHYVAPSSSANHTINHYHNINHYYHSNVNHFYHSNVSYPQSSTNYIHSNYVPHIYKPTYITKNYHPHINNYHPYSYNYSPSSSAYHMVKQTPQSQSVNQAPQSSQVSTHSSSVARQITKHPYQTPYEHGVYDGINHQPINPIKQPSIPYQKGYNDYHKLANQYPNKLPQTNESNNTKLYAVMYLLITLGLVSLVGIEASKRKQK